MEGMSSETKSWIAKNKLVGSKVVVHPPEYGSDGLPKDKCNISIDRLETESLSIPSLPDVGFVLLDDSSGSYLSSIHSDTCFHMRDMFLMGTMSGGSGIRTVELMNGASLGSHAFDGEADLERVVVRDLTDFGNGVFSRCGELKSVDICNRSVATAICLNKTFEHCENLETVSITGSVVVLAISENAFYSCKSLRYLTLPRVSTVESRAFCGCTSLECLELYASEIETFAFSATNIKCLNLADSRSILRNSAFVDVVIGDLHLPQDMSNMKVERGAFCDCHIGAVHCHRGTNLSFMGLSLASSIVYYD